MRVTVTVHGFFSASHQIPDHPACGRLHGHTWRVEVTVEGNISPKTGTATDSAALAFELTKIMAELDHRDLNALLPGVPTTNEGLAGYVRERLLLNHPDVTEVIVSTEDYSAKVEWPLR